MVGTSGSARLEKDLSEPDPIPAAGVDRAVELMESGRLHRYGETGGGGSEVALLEDEFARYLGREYAVAVNSGATAIYLALTAAGLGSGDVVLVNSFTLAPVPGAIEHAGATALLVESTPDLVIDLDDLADKAQAAEALVLSHMRGHIADMDAVAIICEEHGVALIEDCAHTVGGGWGGRPTGTFGLAGCFSAQTFKHLNAGEGGLLVTDDEDLAARAVLYSGSYELFDQHGAAPPEDVFARHRGSVPNLSLRMSALSAAVLRPQLELLDGRVSRWNELYAQLESRLAALPGISTPVRPLKEQYVGSSIQFRITGLEPAAIERVISRCDERGLHVKWFGRAEPRGYTSSFSHWRYLDAASLPQTADVLAGLCDLRIPLSLEPPDIDAIAEILAGALDAEAGIA